MASTPSLPLPPYPAVASLDKSCDEYLSISFTYSGFTISFTYSGFLKCRDQNPVSVFHGPASSSGSISGSLPLMRFHRESLFWGFIINALKMDGLEDSAATSCEPYARELLSGAQSRHAIFYEEFVVKAFFEAEKAHMGQMRVSEDPYLQHYVETAVWLARIGANTMVVAAGLEF